MSTSSHQYLTSTSPVQYLTNISPVSQGLAPPVFTSTSPAPHQYSVYHQYLTSISPVSHQYLTAWRRQYSAVPHLYSVSHQYLTTINYLTITSLTSISPVSHQYLTIYFTIIITIITSPVLLSHQYLTSISPAIAQSHQYLSMISPSHQRAIITSQLSTAWCRQGQRLDAAPQYLPSISLAAFASFPSAPRPGLLRRRGAAPQALAHDCSGDHPLGGLQAQRRGAPPAPGCQCTL
jgi:hypothetical protein